MFRNTKQKSLVLEATKNLCHPTAHQIYLYVKNKCPSISKGTVYRGLDSLIQAGMVHHIAIPNGADCFDWNCIRHYHLVCQKCGQVVDVNTPYQNQFDAGETENMFIQNHTILFYGECPDCYQQGKKENKQ
ncbi:MAG: transcriptional repressor [Alphaproteobacteria bacterium]|nr:transcriptional repressor [Alphaproteobacteria bacterium]MBQ6855366.1 transcriptional repressor [Alphaproteobacteria bacterium]MBR3912694.1 transcriptional repressor [Alphaproteobacteria bacterium]MBR4932510.1 transcriptional repressor [Alphaproteobacteria bacterium]